ncbi:MAG TPA: hypothetical protein VFF04_01990 [Candidatus Babeliales bacterium]|nr:hypothetical protein [Candidatus Babeliales bacterium]
MFLKNAIICLSILICPCVMTAKKDDKLIVKEYLEACRKYMEECKMYTEHCNASTSINKHSTTSCQESMGTCSNYSDNCNSYSQTCRECAIACREYVDAIKDSLGIQKFTHLFSIALAVINCALLYKLTMAHKISIVS